MKRGINLETTPLKKDCLIIQKPWRLSKDVQINSNKLNQSQDIDTK